MSTIEGLHCSISHRHGEMVFLSDCEIKASKGLVAGQDIVFQVRNRKVNLPTQLYNFSSGKMLQSKKCSSQKSYTCMWEVKGTPPALVVLKNNDSRDFYC